MKPKTRSAITAMRTTPPLSTTCTTDSGASEIAATCSAQPTPPTTMPIANHFEVHSAFAAAQRVADVDLGAGARAAVLEEEPEVRGDGAQEREQDAELKGHERVVNAPGRATMALPTVDPVIGTAGLALDPSAARQASGCPAARPPTGKNADVPANGRVPAGRGARSDTCPAGASLCEGRVMRLIRRSAAETLHLPVPGQGV